MSCDVSVDGKHLSLNGQPWRVKGVTYGGFLPRFDGEPFPERWRMKADLADIAGLGLNTVRTYALPPIEMFEIAEEVGLKLLIGLDYADWRLATSTGRRTNRAVLDAGRRAVDAALERSSGFDCTLALSVGNEVPADVVRVHGMGEVEDVLSALVDEIHRGGNGCLATYCNYPTTEFLQVAGQDLACFNVFLEDPDSLRSYLKRLLIVSGDIPLVITELGLASEIHGQSAQADSLEWQLRQVDECGVAGATVYAWTDEWAVAGEPITGWGFGITDADRQPKPATLVVEDWARRELRDLRPSWPGVAVVVCAYNESRTIGECLASLEQSDYPNLEIIVCDDGSTDDTASIARGFSRCTVLQLDHGGLSNARNAGLEAATGQIVAFLDADATCHPEWPYHLALALEEPNVAGVGGPNLPVETAHFAERAIARSPGNPIHVLTGDDRAEHVPGCNMAFRKDDLGAVSWFDPVYTSAGDDVDICWKLLEAWYDIGFSPAAQVRHHRRNTIRGYLKQQMGYGKAERILFTRHPHRFNRLGQASWAGVIYGGPRLLARYLRPVVYHGMLGQAPFQGVVRRRSEVLLGWCQAFVPAVVAIGLAAAIAGAFVGPFLFVTAAAAALLAAFAAAVGAGISAKGERHPIAHRAVVGVLHVLQPVVRAWGRVRNRAGGAQTPTPKPWKGDRIEWLMELRKQLVARRCAIRWGTPLQGWDLEASVGPFVRYRLTTAVMWKWTPQWSRKLRLRMPLLVGAAVFAGLAAGGVTVAYVLLPVLFALAGAEVAWLRRIVDRSVVATTSAAAGERRG